MLEKSAGRGEPLFQEPQLILYRGHTQHATSEHKAAGGKDWDTVKPLSRYFAKMGRVLLVDDDAYKVCRVSLLTYFFLMPAKGVHSKLATANAQGAKTSMMYCRLCRERAET